MDKKSLDLDNKLLKPMKDNLIFSLRKMIATSLTADKDTEVSLKISISMTELVDQDGVIFYEPEIAYKLTEKIKEPKADIKGTLGRNMAIELDEDNNLIVKSTDRQESIFKDGDD